MKIFREKYKVNDKFTERNKLFNFKINFLREMKEPRREKKITIKRNGNKKS